MKSYRSTVCVILSLAVLSVGCDGSGDKGELKTTQNSRSAPVTVRVGWQTAWATQGQVIEALKHSDIVKTHQLQVEFTGFAAGPPAVEAALAGTLDVVSGGSQPMLQLLGKSDEWVVVSRHANVRAGVLVAPESRFKTIKDLQGSKVATPIGSTSERFLLLRMEDEALNPQDITIMNLGIEEIGEFVRTQSKESWGDIAAVSVWEPSVSLLEDKGLARVIEEENDVTLTLMTKRFIKEHTQEAVDYLAATREAWFYYATHQDEMDKLFLKDTSLPISSEMLQKIAKNEPNSSVSSLDAVDITVTPAIQQRLQRTIQLLVEKKKIDRLFDIQSRINTELLEKAQAKASIKKAA